MLAGAGLARAADFPLGPDSHVQPNVPRGVVHKLEWTQSKVYPGTERDLWVYVPVQHRPARPAAVMVFQDGWGFADPQGHTRVPVVLDNLIARKEIPVIVAVFINPGRYPPSVPGAKPRGNRSFEYDALGDRYARFLAEEILPEVNRRWKITSDPAGRAVVGLSSGGICAFTVGWERPDQFGKVVSHIGSFVNIRGGHVYPSLIRKTERKPIRVFLQDGTKDLDNLHGHWPLANQEMAAALAFMGYDHKFVMGEGGHDGKHGGQIFPDTLRWLWRDYPR